MLEVRVLRSLTVEVATDHGHRAVIPGGQLLRHRVRLLLTRRPAECHGEPGRARSGVDSEVADHPIPIAAAVETLAQHDVVVIDPVPRSGDNLAVGLVCHLGLRLHESGQRNSGLRGTHDDGARGDGARELPLAERRKAPGDDEGEREHRNPARTPGNRPHSLQYSGSLWRSLTGSAGASGDADVSSADSPDSRMASSMSLSDSALSISVSISSLASRTSVRVAPSWARSAISPSLSPARAASTRAMFSSRSRCDGS